MTKNLAIVCLSFAFVLMQTPANVAREPKPARREPDRLKQDPEVLRVGVLSQDSRSPVPDLAAEDFIVEENGVRQKVTRFLREERPLSILLLVDSSGSMRPTIQMILASLSDGLNRLTADDEVALMSFNDRVDILQDFTKSKNLVYEKLQGVVAQRPGRMRLALSQAATHIRSATSPDSRRVIVVLTDNRPSITADSISEKVVMQQLSAADSVLCAVVVSDAPPPPRNFSFAAKSPSDIAPYVEETGGLIETVKMPTIEQISMGLVTTIDAFRNYYRIEYYSTNSKRDGTHRKMMVTLSPGVKGGGNKLRVLAKRGYSAPDDKQK